MENPQPANSNVDPLRDVVLPATTEAPELHSANEAAIVVQPNRIAENSLVDFEPFDARTIPVDRIAGLIFAAVITVAAIVGLVVLLTTTGLGWIFFTAVPVAMLILLCLIILAIVWPPIEHRHRAWRLTEVGLEVRHGVWWKHLQAVPWARVQHADVSQGPLQRMYGIGTLTVHTAGTSNSSVDLNGLAHEQAIELRDQIIRQRSSKDVV